MLSKSARSTLKKAPHKASDKIGDLYAIIDESKIGHIAFLQNEAPMVIPMLVWRVGNEIFVHGANNSRLMRTLLKAPYDSCVTFTLFDGWVLARSAFHHSAHYRSAVVFGKWETVENPAEKNAYLNEFIEQIAPSRLDSIRHSDDRELAATMLLKMTLDEASVKISSGAVNDEERDLNVQAWAGFLPYKTVVGPLIADPDLESTVITPDYSNAYSGRWYK
jgi:nitroimidazol reductase NimA-like FMN-containing flavoprotein (pyridoxamine 5'-phosphate oxidase superfamily)